MIRRSSITIGLFGVLYSSACTTERISCDFYPVGDVHVENCAVRHSDGSLAVKREALVRAPFGGEGVAAVWIDRHVYFVTRSGRVAPAFLFDNGADDFVEGLARTVRAGKIGFVDSALTEVVPPRWDFAEPFEGGFAKVCVGCIEERVGEHSIMAGGKWGVIDQTGRVVVPVTYDERAIPAPPKTSR